MNPRGYCGDCHHATELKTYQMVVMTEDGTTYLVGRLYDLNGVQKAVKEIRELYRKHGVTHHVGYMEVQCK
jgi:hypothetical protein